VVHNPRRQRARGIQELRAVAESPTATTPTILRTNEMNEQLGKHGLQEKPEGKQAEQEG
jgi:hypothetical protein